MKVHKLILEMVDKGLTLGFSKEGFSLEGFYKSGKVVFTVKDENTLICTDRYGKTENITCFDEVVYVNHKWWEISKSRGWTYTDTFWEKEFSRLNLEL